MHHSPDAFAGFSLFLKGDITDGLKSALDSWGLVVYSGDVIPTKVLYDLVIEKDQIPMKDSDSIFRALSDKFPQAPAIRTDEKALNLLYQGIPQLIMEVNHLAKVSLNKDLEILGAAVELEVVALILHKMKSTLALIGYVGLQSEVVAWEKIWEHGQGESSRHANWSGHRDALFTRISVVEGML